MKKLLLTTAIACLFFIANAQRNVDWQTTLYSPASGYVIKTSNSFNIQWTFKNGGPDNVKAGDSLLYFISVDGNFLGNPSLVKFAKDMTTTDSLAMNIKNLTISGGDEGTGIPFCVTGFVLNRSATDSAHETDATNNAGCNNVDYVQNTGIAMPGAYVLGSAQAVAYPNPAATNTTLTYDLSSADQVNLAIFDINGKMVQQLVNTKQNPGLYQITTDIADLNSGIYFVKLTVGDRTATTKLTVVH